MDKFLKYVPMLLFCLYCGKMLKEGGSYTEAPILAILGLFSAYSLYRAENKQLQETQKTVDQLKNSIEEQNKKIEELRTHVSGLKLSTSVRGMNNVSNR